MQWIKNELKDAEEDQNVAGVLLGHSRPWKNDREWKRMAH